MDQSLRQSDKHDLSDLRYLFAFLTRDMQLFLAARSRLDSAKFDAAQSGLRIVWEQTVVFFNKYDKLPKLAELKATIIAHLDETDNSDDLTLDTIEEVLDLAKTIKLVDRKKRRPRMRRILRIFLDMSTARDVRRQLEDGGNIRKALREASEQAVFNTAVEQTGTKNWFASMDSAVEEARVTIFPTGVSLVDELTNGRLRSGEVLLHMGAVNSGKTTLAVDVAVSRAKYEVRQAKKENRKNRFVHFYCYEEARQVFAQILARAADIKTDSIQVYLETQDKTTLSSKVRKDYKPYEVKWRRIGGMAIDGELERLEKAFKFLSGCFRFVSMSSEDPQNIELSMDYVHGLVEHFDTNRLITKEQPDLIVIDHASAMVERYMMQQGKQKDERRHLLKQMAMLLRDKIAAPNRIPIWCLHQLGPEENKRPPGSVPDVASGSECRMMHEFFSFALQSSRVTEPDKIGVIALGKKRRMKGADHIPFQIDGDMCRWRDARSTHTIHGGRVRSNSDVAPLLNEEDTPFTPGRRM